jgi:hypothetical protein
MREPIVTRNQSLPAEGYALRADRPAGVLEGQPGAAVHGAHVRVPRPRGGLARREPVQARRDPGARLVLPRAPRRAGTEPELPGPHGALAGPRPLPPARDATEGFTAPPGSAATAASCRSRPSSETCLPASFGRSSRSTDGCGSAKPARWPRRQLRVAPQPAGLLRDRQRGHGPCRLNAARQVFAATTALAGGIGPPGSPGVHAFVAPSRASADFGNLGGWRNAGFLLKSIESSRLSALASR